MANASDPWDWDTERVVQELCTDKRSWKPPTNPPKLPNLEKLKDSLQENLIDGESLLGDGSSAPDFFSDIGVRASKHKETIRAAINQLRNRSSKYKLWKTRQDQGDDDDDDDEAGLHEEFLARFKHIDQANRKRKLEQERGQDSDESAYNTPRASLSESPTQTPSPNTTTKKRKIAPTLLNGDANIDDFCNIPQGILVSEVVPEVDDNGLMHGAYLGEEVLNRADINNFDVSGQPLSDNEFDFEFRLAPYPVGLRRQRSRLVKRRLGNRQHVFRPAKSDMVRGGEDPGHYEVLPAYGESDDEYDNATWREIQQEKKERKERLEAEAQRKHSELPLGEKEAILDTIIEKLKEEWKHEKLPGLEYKAHNIWKNAQSVLKQALDQEKRLIDRYQKRLNDIRATTNTVNYSNKAEMKRLEGNLELTVGDLETSRWKINLLKSPNQPNRLPRIHRPQKPRVPKEHPLDESDGETLGSDTDLEEIELQDFIVEDDDEEMAEPLVDKTIHGPRRSGSSSASIDVQMPNAQDTDDVPMGEGELAMDLDAPSPSPDGPPAAEPSESSDLKPGPTAQDNSSTEGSPGIKPDGVPAAIVNQVLDAAETLDLTQPAMPAIKREVPSTPRSKSGLKIDTVQGKETIDLTTPVKSNSPAVSFSPSQMLNVSPIDEQGLSENEKYVLAMLDRLEEHHRSSVVLLASKMESDLVWTGLLLPALRKADYPKLPSSSKEDLDSFRGLHIARLFDAFLGSSPPHLKRWFDAEGRSKLEEKADQFYDFLKFLRKLSLRYVPGIAAQKPPASATPPKNIQAPGHVRGNSIDDETDQDVEESNVDESPTKKKRKSTIVRNQQAQDLRKFDQKRIKEQEERKNAMRAKLALHGDTQVSPDKTRFIINESKDNDEGYIYVPDNIAGMIKDHQISGIRFMWNQIVTNTEVRQGCLLAHTMGLGKTMQIITLLITIAQSAASKDPSISSQIPEDLKESRTLVLAPAGLVNNWMDELYMWTGETNHHLGEFYKIDASDKMPERQGTVQRWSNDGGVLVLGYNIFKILLKNESLEQILLQKPNLVVADEAHYMKNPNSRLHTAVNFKTHLRLALTGSPLANNVLEYHSMINWVAPNYLSDLREFRHDFANPIEEGLGVDATRYSRRKALTRLKSLKDTVAPKVHRRTIHSLKDDLPQKTEFVICIPLTELQKKVYETHLKFVNSDQSPASAFALIEVLTLLCNHPSCFRQKLLKEAPGGTELGGYGSASANGNASEAADEEYTSAGATPDDSGAEASTAPIPGQLVSNQLQLIQKNVDNLEGQKESWKIPILKKIVKESRAQEDSVLVFSHSLETIDYLERILKRDKLQVTTLTGQTKVKDRQTMIKNFNAGGPGIFLISTRAGGLGLNITGANRVILFDARFNPQHELQAVGRAYRLGQQKPVFVYRFVCGGTFEEKLQNRGIFKMQLASRVVDEKNPIPKAQRLEEMFQMPSEPVQEDLEPFKGKDKVLDAILASHEGDGIRSIVMADTFEEENLDDEQLTNEEQSEASWLVKMHQDRLTGKPQVPFAPVVTGSHQATGVLSMPSQPHPGYHQPGTHPLPAMHRSYPHPNNSQAVAQQANNTVGASHLRPSAQSARRQAGIQNPFPQPIAQPANPQAAAAHPNQITGKQYLELLDLMAEVERAHLELRRRHPAIPELTRRHPAALPASTEGPTHPAFQSGTASPVPGVTTQIREATAHEPVDPSALRYWAGPNILKGELARVLMRNESDDGKKEHVKMVARTISETFNELRSSKDTNELARAKMALVDAAIIPTIAKAITSGEYTPQQLAAFSATDYSHWMQSARFALTMDQANTPSDQSTKQLNSMDEGTSARAIAEMASTPDGRQDGPSTQHDTEINGDTSVQTFVTAIPDEERQGKSPIQQEERAPSTQVGANTALSDH
ncbi:hypothetical protein PFICI_11509 [Pestalotiopsis fici W106-1]|uniref:Uncharacterized protein n=1 Tax=Pestalotiopsis fici (strain W106-1 / CGMCC3.15140) TaxID=1229662 RepID=W3WSH7_PESFW|nr:uncharacterized protein PFICI_11509 [Pestalotiopsis fici W106-1]ETS76122.1 hypothetical protein PFICI_11509 [Pestalotiopsis fici W106-1]